MYSSKMVASERTPLVPTPTSVPLTRRSTPYITTTNDDSVDSVTPYTVKQDTIYTPNREYLQDYTDESNIVPRLQRSKTFSENAMNGIESTNVPVSVNNPLNLSRRLSAFPGNDFDELYKRVDSLKLMRPFRLIGPITRLVDWKKYTKSENYIKNLKNNELKDFYNNQNDMISRYEDIDLLLDTGIQIQMIENYADNTSTDASSNASSDYNDNDDNDDDNDNSNSNSNINSNYIPSTEGTSIGENLEQLTLPLVKSKKMMKQNSIETGNTQTSSKKRHHIQSSAVPGNIDLEGAKILGNGHDSSSSIVMYAIYFNFALNVILLCGKIIVVYMSNSLSLIASLVDSALDFLSTLIIFIANKYAAKHSSKFPVGRKQLEPIGVLIFSVIIIISFSQVLIESLKELFGNTENGNREIVNLTKTAISIMVGTITTKLIGYELCKNIKNSSVQALVEDAKTDIVFNVFSLIFPSIGVLFNIWWIDALGASILCCYVILQWWMITFEHIDHLSGSKAPKEDYQQVLYMIVRFTDEISKVKNYRMYHMGDQVNVEVDIVLKNANMSLKDCHDLGESLQYAIETLPYVNRCFVHIDYKVRNYVGHLTG